MPDHLDQKYFLDQESYSLFCQNEILQAPDRIIAALKNPDIPEERIRAKKWQIFHLIIASEYREVRKLVKGLHKEDFLALPPQSQGDIKYCRALKAYYQGSFQKTIRLFSLNEAPSIIELHIGNDYQLGHDHKLLGKAYWKMGFYTRAFFHFYLAISHFNEDNPNSIWIAKVYGLIAVVYFQKEKFKDGENFITIAKAKLENIWEKRGKEMIAPYQKHHIYACVCNDEAEGLMGQSHAAFKEENWEGFQTKNQKTEEQLYKAESIFKSIYQVEGQAGINRYSAIVYKNLGVLNKRKAFFIPDPAKSNALFVKAKEWMEMDISYRKKLFWYKKKSGKIITQHSTLGRVYNHYAQMCILQVEKNYTNLNNREKKELLLEAFNCAHTATHYIVKNNIPLSFEEKPNNKGGGIKINELEIQNFNKVQSYRVLIQAFHLKLAALYELVKIDKSNTSYQDVFKRVQETSFEFISVVRKQYQTRSANLALSTVIKPLYEVVLNFLYNQGKDRPDTKNKWVPVQQKIIDAFENSKNSELVRTFEDRIIDTRKYELLIKSLLENFSFDSEKEDFEEFEDAAIEELKKRKKEICENCVELLKRDRSEKKPEDPPSVEDIQQRMRMPGIGVYKDDPKKPSSLLISFFYGDSSIFVFTLDAFNVNFIKLPNLSPKKLEELIRELVKLMNQTDYIEGDRKGAYIREYLDYTNKTDNLYKNLIKPLGIYGKGENKEKISHRLLVIIPDEQLHYLPFDAIIVPNLKDKEKQKPYNFLIEDYYTSYHFSISLLYKSIRERETNSDTWDNIYTGIASNLDLVKAKRKMPNLMSPGSDLNIEVISAIRLFKDRKLPTSKINGFLNPLLDNPNPHRFYQNLPHNISSLHHKTQIFKCIQNVQILHFATHSLSDMTSIQLTQTFRLGEHEIDNIKKIGLVILNGCDTGKGSLSKGEGHEALGRLFLNQQGIRNVIYSVTAGINLDQEYPEDELMEHFFKFLLEHLKEKKKEEEKKKKKKEAPKTYPGALAEAKREIIKKYPTMPQFMSGLVFVGCSLDYFDFPKENLLNTTEEEE